MPIADKTGIWLVNRGQFAMIDHETNTRFEPGEPVKAAYTDFLKSQPTIERCADPSNDLSEKEQARLQEQIAADEAARQAREAAAEQTMAADNAKQSADLDAAAKGA